MDEGLLVFHAGGGCEPPEVPHGCMQSPFFPDCRPDVDEPITLEGWVHRVRDLGGIRFLVLRDREGLAQVVLPPDLTPTTPPAKASSA